MPKRTGTLAAVATRRPHVLFVTSAYPTPEMPASGIFVREHARAVAPHCEVAILHLDRREGARFPFQITSLADEPFPAWRVSYPARPLALSLPFHVLAAFAGYRRALREGHRPDLLHAHFFIAAAPAALLSVLHRTPMIATEQWTAFLSEDPFRLGPVLEAVARIALRRAAVVLPVSRDLQQAMSCVGVRGPFDVVPNAVDVDLFAPSTERRAGPPRLVTVGGINHQKAMDVLVEAVAATARTDLQLDVVGDGPERAKVAERIATLGLSEQVRIHGMQPKERIAAILSDADLFVLASRYDNNPCVLVEAQAAGLPIVATDVGGIPEIVDDDRSGVLVERESADSLAEGILTALARLTEYDSQAIAARARRRYSLEGVGRRLADIYLSVLDGPGGRESRC